VEGPDLELTTGRESTLPSAKVQEDVFILMLRTSVSVHETFRYVRTLMGGGAKDES